MKKVITRAVFIATFVCAAGYSLYTSQHETQLADLAMANVEALANDEGSGEKAYCWTQFSGGLAWPRQCPSCERLPFATGLGTAGTCNVK